MTLCGIGGCGRAHYSRGWCEAHYARWRRSGVVDPATVGAPNWARPAVSCTKERCDRAHYAKGFCEVHYKRWQKHGDPDVLASSAPINRRTKSEHHNWFGDDVGYRGAHHRITREMGPAASHSCRQCGETAMDWAYDHTDPDEQVDSEGRVFSPDPDRYMAMCRKCHSAFDRGCTAS